MLVHAFNQESTLVEAFSTVIVKTDGSFAAPIQSHVTPVTILQLKALQTLLLNGLRVTHCPDFLPVPGSIEEG